jgi:hypothetical protein
MGSYRVFISYSHEDMGLAEKIVGILEEQGLTPMWDRNFAFGHGFHDQIKNFIAHAHVFMPILTNTSSQRGWVHQEIGYALALNVPVLPVTKDQLPGEMLQQLHAISLSDDREILGQQLSMEIFNQLVFRAQKNSRPLFEWAEDPVEGTMMMVEYATRVLELNAYGHVRQRGELSSFSIPDKHPADRIWKQRHGPMALSDFHCKLLREERRLLERHARRAGISLIVNTQMKYDEIGDEAMQVRLKTLLSFLESLADDEVKVTVGIDRRLPKDQHFTILGDWFAVEATLDLRGIGYRQAVFTRHAANIRNRIDLFEDELHNLLEAQGINPESSRAVAIAKIKEMLPA